MNGHSFQAGIFHYNSAYQFFFSFFFFQGMLLNLHAPHPLQFLLPFSYPMVRLTKSRVDLTTISTGI